MGTPWDWMALRLQEKAAEAAWRASITRHTSQDIAGRLYAWRHLERKRAELHAWMAMARRGEHDERRRRADP